jgi:hypothetical protein
MRTSASPEGDPLSAPSTRHDVDPGMSEERLVTNTGKGWDEWVAIIDGWNGNKAGPATHTAIAAYVRETYGIEGWWAQCVTVGYERLTGRRSTHQRSDGTFVASKSRTVAVSVVRLREALLDETARSLLFPGQVTELRSKRTSKSIRIGFGEGVALMELRPTDRDPAKVVISVAHEKLATPDEVEVWRRYWGQWLDELPGHDLAH